MAAEYGSGGGGRQRRPVADDRQLQHYMEDPDLDATSIITELVSLEDPPVPYSSEEMESELCAPLESSFASSIGEGMYARFPSGHPPNTSAPRFSEERVEVARRDSAPSSQRFDDSLADLMEGTLQLAEHASPSARRLQLSPETPPTKMKGKKRGKKEEKEKEVKKDGDVKIDCLLCEEKFACKRTLSDHIMSTDGHQELMMFEKLVGDVDFKFNCDVCTRRFYKWEGLRIHQMKMHGAITDAAQMQMPDRDFGQQCPLCRMYFQTAHSLSEHIASAHSDFAGKLFSCNQCDKSYRHNTLLIRHKHTKHNAPLKFKRKKGEASSSASTSIIQGTSSGEPATEGVRDEICDGDDVIGETEGNGDVIVKNEWWRADYELSASEEEIKQKVLNLLSMKDKLAAADICGKLFKDWQEKAMKDYPDLCEVIVKHGLIFGPLPKLHEEVDKQIRQSQAKQTPRKTLKKRSKINDQELACPECEYRTRSVATWLSHLLRIHNTTPILAGLALLCACGQESFSFDHVYKCDVADFTIIRKRDGPIKRLNDKKETPQCVLCEMYPRTASGFVKHLRVHHKSTLKEHNIYLKCACGVEYHRALDGGKSLHHGKECDGRLFTLHKLDEK